MNLHACTHSFIHSYMHTHVVINNFPLLQTNLACLCIQAVAETPMEEEGGRATIPAATASDSLEIEAEESGSPIITLQERLRNNGEVLLNMLCDEFASVLGGPVTLGELENDGGLVGSGTQGEVFPAMMKGWKVAVKIITNQHDLKYSHEIQHLTTLASASTNIISLLAFVSLPDVNVLVFPLFHLGTLKMTDPPLDYPTIRDYISQLAGAISTMHQHNIIHRDIKPANILIADEGRRCRLVVADLGSSIRYVPGSGLITTAGGGTWYYFSPEVYRCYWKENRNKKLRKGDGYNEQTDYYALGILFVEMMCPGISLDYDDIKTRKKRDLKIGKTFYKKITETFTEEAKGAMIDLYIQVTVHVNHSSSDSSSVLCGVLLISWPMDESAGTTTHVMPNYIYFFLSVYMFHSC